MEAARGVCEKLGIEHVLVDARERFTRLVVEPFTEACRAGRVANPYMLWTAPLLVPVLLEEAERLGCDAAATGHYAGIERDADADGAGAGADSGLLPLRLVRAADVFHDESYYLYQLGQDQLARLRFPLHATAKPVARQMAMREGLLPLAPLLDDYDPFFLDGMSARAWACGPGGIDDAPGPVVVLGAQGESGAMHDGLLRHAPGEVFEGLRGAGGEELFVVAKDAASRTLYVGPAALAAAETCLADDVVWTSVEPAVREPGQTRSCRVKTAWDAKAVPAQLSFAGEGRVLVSFSEARRGIEPDGTCVFYSDALVLGGGRIAG